MVVGMKEKGVYWTTGKKHKPLTTCTTLTTYYLIHLSSYIYVHKMHLHYHRLVEGLVNATV